MTLPPPVTFLRPLRGAVLPSPCPSPRCNRAGRPTAESALCALSRPAARPKSSSRLVAHFWSVRMARRSDSRRTVRAAAPISPTEAVATHPADGYTLLFTGLEPHIHHVSLYPSPAPFQLPARHHQVRPSRACRWCSRSIPPSGSARRFAEADPPTPRQISGQDS